METTSSVLQASVGGILELLALSGTGAVLSHLGHFSASISAALSNAVYKVFLPALMLASILETVNHALSGNAGALQDVWVPIAAAILIFLITAVVAHPLTLLLANGKEEAVRRVIWTCIVLGNSNTMALLVMQSICDSFPPLNEDPTCLIRSTGYASLYITIVTLFTSCKKRIPLSPQWTIIFQYLCDAPDCPVPPVSEQEQLLPPATFGGSPPHTVTKNGTSFGVLLKRGLLSPPSLAVGLATVLACIPGVPGLFVNEHGPLRPLLLSINQVGSVAIPLSSMIVGAELHRSLTSTSSPEASPVTRPSQTFGMFAIAIIFVIRLVLLPWLGRLLHRWLGLTQVVHDPLLSVFTLVEWTVPTANNCIIMYLALPVFLTINTTLVLWLQFPDA